MIRAAAQMIDRLVAAYWFPRERQAGPPDVAALERFVPEAQRSPEEFYALPATATPAGPSFEHIGRLGRVMFLSPVATVWPENNIVHVHVRGSTGGSRTPTVVLLHGWRESAMVFSRLMHWGFAAAHMNALLVELPFHFHRTPAGEVNGGLILTGDIVRTIRALKQAVLDVRLVVEWVRAAGTGTVGLFGNSLGGLVAALTAVATDRLDFAILNTPALDLAASAMEDGVWKACRGHLLRRWRGHEELVREALRIVTPRRFPLRLPRERVLLIEGCYDLLVPSSHTEALWEAWGRPPRVQYRHGHITNFALNGLSIWRVSCEFIRGLS